MGGTSTSTVDSTTYGDYYNNHIDDRGDIYLTHYGSNSYLAITNTFDIERLIIYGHNNTVYLDDVEEIRGAEFHGNNYDVDITRIRENNISQADATLKFWSSGSDIYLNDGFNLNLWFYDNGADGNGNNTINIYNFWNIDIDLQGDRNYLYAYDVDDVYIDAYGSHQNLNIVDSFDIERIYISGHSNRVYLYDVEYVTLNIGGGNNDIDIFYVAENGISFANTDIDIYGGGNNLYLDDIFDLDLDIRGGYNTIYANNATSININTHGNGENNVTLTDVDDVYLYFGAGTNHTRIHSTAEFSADITIHGLYGTNHITTSGGFEATVHTYGQTNDTVLIGAGGTYVYTYGGDDHIDTLGAFRAHVDAGDGNDTIYARGADTTINAGSGNNTIVASGIGVTVNAGDGNDTLTVDAAIGNAYLGNGHNTVNFNVGVGTVFVGNGNDTINVNALGAAINAGEGDNTINFNGFAGNIQVGNGNDTVRVNAAGVSLNAGGGNNNIYFNGFAADIDVGDGDDNIYVNAFGVDIDARNGNNNFYVNAAGASLRAGAGDDYAEVRAGVGLLDLGNGNNTVELYAVGGNINVGSGHDTIIARVLGAEINAGDGDNTFNVHAGGAKLTAGSGDDTAYVGAAVGLLDLGHGDNAVELNVVGGNINVGNGNDTLIVNALGADLNAGGGENIIIAKSFGVSVDAGAGNDRIWSLGVGGQQINSGDGNDTITAYGGVNVIFAGHGHNEIEVAGGLNVVQAGYGNNVIDAYGGANIVLSGHGNNDIEAYGGANAVFVGDGDNEIVAGGGLNIIAVGDGENTIFAAGGLNIILAGNGDSSLNTRAQAVTAADRGANLVENGSFELGTEDGVGISFRVPDGWHQSFGQLEVHDTAIFNDSVSPFGFSSSGNGRHILELDGTQNSGIYQDIETREGATYEVTLSYRGTTTVSAASNTVEVWWAGAKVGEIAATHTDWRDYTFTVTGDDVSRLELRAGGASDLLGGAVDNIRVNEVLNARANGDGVLDVNYDAEAAADTSNVVDTGLVKNGSFELGAEANTAISFAVPTGWTQSFGQLEVHDTRLIHDGINQFGHSASGSGDYILELDGTQNSGIYQDLDTKAGISYEITISYRGTTTVAAESNAIEVWWGGNLVGTIADTHTDWRDYSFAVTGQDTSRLEFRSAGTSDLLGGAIDNVRVEETNLIVNGSFESARGLSSDHALGTPEGWTASFGAVENLNLNYLGIANDHSGHTAVELAGTADAGIYQDVDTISGASYTLTIDYRARYTSDAAENRVEIWWGGQKVGEIADTHTDWRSYTFEVTGAASDLSRLELKAAGGTHHLGGVIDNVSLVENNLVVNGSFEAGRDASSGHDLGAPLGWTTSFGAVENLNLTSLGLSNARSDDTGVELVGAVNSGIYQDIDTTHGASYRLTIDYQARVGSNPDENRVEIWWDGKKVGEIAETHPDWRTYTFDVVGGISDASRLELKATGGSSHLGGVIDNVTVVKQNLITNGSFEEGRDAASAHVLGTPQGWHASFGAVETLNVVSLGRATADSGHTAVELVGATNGGIYQDINTGQGASYELSIDYAARYAGDPQENLVEIWWDGQKVGEIADTHPEWRTYTFQVKGGFDATTRLELRAAGGTHHLGGLVDNVSLEPVAPPTISEADIFAEVNANDQPPAVPADTGNEIYAYGIGNLVISGSGDDEIFAGSLLNLAADLAVSEASNSDNALVSGLFGTSTGTAFGEESAGSILLNGIASVANLGNIVIAGNGDNIIRAYGGYNLVQAGSGNDDITTFGQGNLIVAGNGDNTARIVGLNNAYWGGSGDDTIELIGGNNILLLGTGNNTVTGLALGANLIVGGGNATDVDDIVITGSSNFLFLGSGTNNVVSIGGSNIVLGGQNEDKIFTIGNFNFINLGDGNNSTAAIGATNFVLGGEGRDEALILGGKNVALLGNGDNDVLAGGYGNAIFTGSGNDTVVSAARYNVISTAGGDDTLIVAGEVNLVHSGNGNDFLTLAGRYNVALTGGGDDVIATVGAYNVILSEAGNDTIFAAGKDNFILSASGNDNIVTLGKYNLVAAGSGSDIVVAFGQSNFIVTDNEITISPQELAEYQERVKAKKQAEKDAATAADKKSGAPTQQEAPKPAESTTTSTNAAGASATYENADYGASVTAAVAASGSASILFPDIEFSNPDAPDIYIPGFDLPQIDLTIPDSPELRSRPGYEYGDLGAYGLPAISLPDLTIPDLNIPGQTLPNISLPDFSQFGFRDDGLTFDVTLDIAFNPDFYNEINNIYKDLAGAESSVGNGSILTSSEGLRIAPNGGDPALQAYSENQADIGPASATSNTFFQADNIANSETYSGYNQGGYATVRSEQEFRQDLIPTASTWTGRVLFTSATSIEDAVAQLGAAPANSFETYKVDALNFHETSSSVADFLAGAGIAYTGDGAQANEQVIHEITGQLYLTKGVHTFEVSHDDYARIEIGGQQVLNVNYASYYDQGTTFTFTAEADGVYDFKSTVYDRLGSSYLKVEEIIPGVNAGDPPTRQLVTYDNYKPPLDYAAQIANEQYSTIDLPTFTLPELSVPAFSISGLDLSGLGDIDQILGGREFFGLTVPEFSIPSEYLAIPDFNLSDYASQDALTLAAQAFTIPSLEIPNIAGIDWSSRIGSFSQTFDFLQASAVDGGDGDIALVAGRENRVYTGGGDDGALVLGQENTVFAGDGNDAVAVIGTDFNFVEAGAGADLVLGLGKTNILGGGAGNDIIVGIGENNTLRAGTNQIGDGSDDNILIALGKSNKIEAANNSLDLNGGKDFAFALGSDNDVNLGVGDDTIFAAGVKNKLTGGAGADLIVGIGNENTLNLARGNDVGIAVGLNNTIEGDDAGIDPGADVIFAAGLRNKVNAAGGADSVFALGAYNIVTTGGDDDLSVTAGTRNIASLGSGNDVSISLGVANLTTGGLGNDVIANVGAFFGALGGEGNDTFLNFGNGVLSGDAGDDVFLNFGVRTLELLGQSSSGVSGAIAGAIDALDVVIEHFGTDTSTLLGELFSFADNSILTGGSGSDTFVAGFGNSRAFGGEGADTYVYTVGSGLFSIIDETITDLSENVGSLGQTAEGLTYADSGGNIENYFNEVEAGTLSAVTGGTSSGLDDAFVDVLEFRTAADQMIDLTTNDLYLSQDGTTIDLVYAANSIGQVTIDRFGDNDIIRVVDHDSVSELTFGALRARTTADSMPIFNEFDSVASVQNGIQQTIDFLAAGSTAVAADPTAIGRQIENGAFSEVTSIYNDLAVLNNDALV